MVQRAGPSAWYQQVGLLTSIPVVLLVGPALGYYLGSAVDRRWPVAPWGLTAGLVCGLAASLKVVIQLIRRSGALDRHE
jgi:F0F1-type ATP synthase assembly protein I